jgi:hypothetical protein
LMKPDKKTARKRWWKHASEAGGLRAGRAEQQFAAEVPCGDPAPTVVTPNPVAIIRISSAIIIVVGVPGPG